MFDLFTPTPFRLGVVVSNVVVGCKEAGRKYLHDISLTLHRDITPYFLVGFCPLKIWLVFIQCSIVTSDYSGTSLCSIVTSDYSGGNKACFSSSRGKRPWE